MKIMRLTRERERESKLPLKKQRQQNWNFFLVLLFFVGMFFINTHNAHAALINATGVFGQLDANGNILYTSGESNGGANAKGFNTLTSTAVDTVNHRLFVSDAAHNRVLVFNLDSNDNIATNTASYVIGQTDFVSTTAGRSQSKIGTNNSNINGLAYDSVSSRLFVGDANRVLVFNVATSSISNGMNASYVLGQTNFGTNDSLHGQKDLISVADVAYDPINSRLFVADKEYAGNNRVMVFNVATSSISNYENASYVLGQPDFATYTSPGTLAQNGIVGPGGLSYDATSTRLFVADSGANRIMVFNVATSTIANGMNASYVLGVPDFTTVGNGATTQGKISINSTASLSYDGTNQRLFVPDYYNNRIMIFNVATSSIANGENASNVLGSSNFTSTNSGTTQAYFGNGVKFNTYIPTSQILLVSDYSNNRILVFSATSTITNGANAIGELGHSSSTTTPSYTKSEMNWGPNNYGLYNPGGSALDTVHHRLFINDGGHSRVMVYNLDSNNHQASTTAAYVIGQSDFTGSNPAATQSGLSTLQAGSVYDPVNDRLFVSDRVYNRVLVYDVSAGHIANGMNASYVLGQPDFTTVTAVLRTQNRFSSNDDIDLDSTNQRLFVADADNNRTLVFNVAPGTIANGMNAAYVLGQADFTHNVSTITQNNLGGPAGQAYDSVNNRLFVGDYNNNRIMVFNVATSSIANGENALYVLGVNNFTTNPGIIWSASSTPYADDLTYDPVHSLLFDSGWKYAHRIMVFNVATSTISNGENALINLGQSDWTSNNANTTQSGFNGSDSGPTYDPTNNRIFTTQWNASRIMEFSLVKITTASLPAVTVNTAYNQTLTSTSSQGTLNWYLASSSAALPAGLTLATTTGVLSGTPTVAGTYTFTIQVDDSYSTGYFFDTVTYTIQVNPSVVVPTLTTSVPTLVSTSTMTLNANISATGGASITGSGFAYSTDSALISGVSTTTLGSQSGTGNFSGGITGLTPNILYYFRAYAVNSAGTSTGAILSTTTLALTVPSQPTSVTAATSSPNQATISFTPGSNGGSPILYYLASSTPGNFTGTSSGAPIVISGLTNGTSYTFQVYAVNAVGTSTPSSASNAVTPITIPTILTPTFSGVTASGATASSSISATGGANASIEGFAWGTDTSYSLGTTSSSGSFGISSFQNATTTLTCNTTYHVRAYATNSGGTGYSSDGSFTTNSCVTVPTLTTSVPTLVSTSTMTLNGSITADGNASSTIRGFAWGTNSNLSGGDTATTTETPGPFGIGSFTKALTGLTASTTYYFRSYAVNSVGTSTGSILSTSTLQWSVPGVPTGVTATAGNAQASVTFSAPGSTGGSTITGYTVISNPAGGTDTNAGMTALTHTVTGLVNGTPYTFTVTATNIIGTSSASSASSPVTPITVSSITTSAASNTSTSTVTMNANIGSIGGASVTQHGFAYGTVSNLSTVIATTSLGSVGTGDFNQSLSSLTPNTTYYFRAYSVNAAGTSTGSILSFNTNDITPPVVAMTSPTTGATVAGASVSLSATASDDVAVSGVQFKLDGTTNVGSEVTVGPYTTTWNSTSITSYGSHTLYAVARDAAGNYSTSTVTVNVDNVAPTLVSDVYNSDTQITVTLSKLANAGTITKANDGGFTVAKTGAPGTTFTVSSIAPGSDNTKVVLTVASMTSVGGAGVKVTYSHSGNGTIADTLGNLLATDGTGITIPPWNTVAPIISNITSTVSNGSYKLGSAIDINLTFSKQVTSTGSVTVTLNTGGTCSFTVSNSTTASCTYTVGSSENANPLNVSSVAGTITSTDSNAMTSFTPALNLSANKTIIVDTTAPTVSVTVPSNSATVSGTSVTLTATNSDAGSGIAGIQFVLDGTTNIGSSGVTNPYSVTWDSSATTNASHTISAVARDAAGNRATSTVTVTVDNNLYTIGGTISGQSDTVVLQNNSGDNKSISTSTSSFTFATGLLYGNTYNITVLTQPSGQTCSVSNGSGTMTSSNVTNVSVICTNNPVAPTPTPTVTSSQSSSSGGSASSQVSNLIAMGNYALAQQIAKQFGILIPIQNIPTQNDPANTPSAPTSNGGQLFTRTLKVGATSNDVKKLQIFLNSQGFIVAKKGAGSPGHETTTFGPATKTALMKFQLAHKKETLDPQGLKAPTGFFGVDTMKAVNKLMKSQ